MKQYLEKICGGSVCRFRTAKTLEHMSMAGKNPVLYGFTVRG